MADYTSEHAGSEIDHAVKNANLMLLTGAADPNTTTVGTLGQIYQNTTDGTLFRCTAIAGTDYTWTEWTDYSPEEQASKADAEDLGDITALETTVKTSAVAAINENADLISTNCDVTLTNKITNGGFATDTTGWTKFFVTLTSVGGVAEMTGQNAPDGTNRASQFHGVPEGNKWYASADVKATTNLAGIGVTTAHRLASHSGEGNWERLSFVRTRTTDDAVTLVDNRTSGWDTVYFDNILVVDLTAKFGAGNEPTKANMDFLVGLVPNNWWDGTLTLKQSIVLEALLSLRNQIVEKTSYGVYTGLVVAQQTTPDMTVKVSAGTIYMANGDRFTPSAVASLAVTAADATNPRIDIVYVSSVGAITYLTGTAAESPSAPAVPAGGQKLAEISVANGATTVETANIADRRKNLWTEAWIRPTFVNGWTENTGYKVSYFKDALGNVHMRGLLTGGSALTTAFILPAGYRPSERRICAIDNTGNYSRIFIQSDGVVTPGGIGGDLGGIIFSIN